MGSSFLDDWLDTRSDAEFNIGESGVNNARLDEIIEPNAIAQVLGSVDFDHNDTKGSFELRQQVAALYEHADANNVLITAGASEAILVYFLSRRAFGANVVVVVPTFHNLFDVPKALGFQVRTVHHTLNTSFELPVQEIIDQIDEHTRAVVLTTPSNPFGTVYSHSEMNELIDHIAFLDCDLIVDEQYRLLTHHYQLSRYPSMANATPNILGIGSAGKCYGVVGLRVGWVVGDSERIEQLNDSKLLATHAICKLNDTLCRWLLQNGQQIANRHKVRVIDNKLALSEFIEYHSEFLEWVEPRGGTTAFPRVKWQESSTEFAQTLYSRYGVLILPGEAFAMPDHFRVRLGLEREGFKTAIARIGECLRMVKLTHLQYPNSPLSVRLTKPPLHP